jgi:hypothetical protein
MEVGRDDLAIISGVLTAICVIPYLRDVYRGSTRPQRVSWFVFATLSIVVAVSQFAEGAHAGAWLASGSALGFTLVFLASLQHGVGGTSLRDVVSLSVALAGTAVSILIERPIVAVFAVIAAELAAISLTARKALREPASETASTWLIDGLAGVFAVFAVTEWSVTELLYPVHHVIVNAWVLGAIALGTATENRGESYRAYRGTKSYSPTPCSVRNVAEQSPPLVTRCGRRGSTVKVSPGPS